MNPHHAARPHKNILVPIRHPHHFMRNHLPNRKNQVMPAIPQQLVHLRRPAVVHLPLTHLVNKLARHLAQRHNIVPPVVHPEQPARRLPEHRRNLLVRHRRMRAQRRQHIHQLVAVVLPRQLRQHPSLRVEPRKIRRNRQHPLPLPQPLQRSKKIRPQIGIGHLGSRRSSRKKKTHSPSILRRASIHKLHPR